MAEGRSEAGIGLFEKAVRDRPRDPEAKALLMRHKAATVDNYLREAERQRAAGIPDAAESYYTAALRIDPNNARANQGLLQLVADRRNTALLLQAEQLLQKGDFLAAERLGRIVRNQDPLNLQARRLLGKIDEQRAREQSPAPNPAVKAALAKPVAISFRDATLKSVFETLSRYSGLNFIFDREVKGDAKITLFVRNSSLEDIVKLILRTNQLEKWQLNDNSFLIYPNTAAKAREYQELVVRNFYLVNTDVKQAHALVKAVVKSKDIHADDKLNLLTVKDTPDAIRLVERLVDSLDLSEPEVMLEVEILEVTRSRLKEIGLDWPDSVGYGLLQSLATTTTIVNGVTQSVTTPGGSLTPGYVDIRNRSGLTGFVANPAFTLKLMGQNGDTNVLANPRIRVKNKEKAKIHIGGKLPIFTTTSTANVGVSASVNYLDVGLKLDVEPNVSLDDEVSIKVGLEVSSIVKEVLGPSGSLAYEVGTRSASTVLRLKNGETQVLAGLISDEERKSTNHVPGLGEVPILGRLFGSQRDTSSKTEVMLLITPRIMRNINLPDTSQPVLGSGTELAVGAPPLSVKTLGPRSFEMSSGGGSQGEIRTRGAESQAATASPPAAEKAADNAHPATARLSGPGEFSGDGEADIAVTIPGLTGTAQVVLAFDPALVEAVRPIATIPGRVIAVASQGKADIRLRALPGATGEARIELVAAVMDTGQEIEGTGAVHTLKFRSP